MANSSTHLHCFVWMIKKTSLICPLVWGMILAKVIFKKNITRLKNRITKDIFQSCKRIIKDNLSSSQTQCIED